MLARIALNLPMTKARGFLTPPYGGPRGSFRPRQRVCSPPRSRRGREPSHTRRTPIALPTSLCSQWDQRDSHMPNRSWWKTSMALRRTAYRLQCTCRPASTAVEHARMRQRSCQTYERAPGDGPWTTPGTHEQPRAAERVYGSDRCAGWRAALAAVPPTGTGVHAGLVPAAWQSLPVRGDGGFSRHSTT